MSAPVSMHAEFIAVVRAYMGYQWEPWASSLFSTTSRAAIAALVSVGGWEDGRPGGSGVRMPLHFWNPPRGFRL